MCGRLAIDELVDALVRAYLAEAVGWEDALTALPNWDVRPTDTIPMLVESARRGGARILAPARWGLLAPGAPATGEPPRFNARLETLGARPTWREPLARMRCVVPATAYYEWQGPGGARTPYAIRDPRAPRLSLAGLAQWWRPAPTAPWRLTATVVTRPALGALADIHDRMPLALPDELVGEWIATGRVGDQGFAEGIAAAAEDAGLGLVATKVASVPPAAEIIPVPERGEAESKG